MVDGWKVRVDHRGGHFNDGENEEKRSGEREKKVEREGEWGYNYTVKWKSVKGFRRGKE